MPRAIPSYLIALACGDIAFRAISERCGVFADPADERAFVDRLERDPPALVLWPLEPFDRMPSRSLEVQAPLVTDWVRRHYVPVSANGFREIALVPRG